MSQRLFEAIDNKQWLRARLTMAQMGSDWKKVCVAMEIEPRYLESRMTSDDRRTSENEAHSFLSQIYSRGEMVNNFVQAMEKAGCAKYLVALPDGIAKPTATNPFVLPTNGASTNPFACINLNKPWDWSGIVEKYPLISSPTPAVSTTQEYIMPSIALSIPPSTLPPSYEAVFPTPRRLRDLNKTALDKWYNDYWGHFCGDLFFMVMHFEAQTHFTMDSFDPHVCNTNAKKQQYHFNMLLQNNVTVDQFVEFLNINRKGVAADALLRVV